MDDLTVLKAEIFDLQVEMAAIRQKIEAKVKQYNVLIKKNENKGAGQEVLG